MRQASSNSTSSNGVWMIRAQCIDEIAALFHSRSPHQTSSVSPRMAPSSLITAGMAHALLPSGKPAGRRHLPPATDLDVLPVDALPLRVALTYLSGILYAHTATAAHPNCDLDGAGL